MNYAIHCMNTRVGSWVQLIRVAEGFLGVNVEKGSLPKQGQDEMNAARRLVNKKAEIISRYLGLLTSLGYEHRSRGRRIMQRCVLVTSKLIEGLELVRDGKYDKSLIPGKDLSTYAKCLEQLERNEAKEDRYKIVYIGLEDPLNEANSKELDLTNFRKLWGEDR